MTPRHIAYYALAARFIEYAYDMFHSLTTVFMPAVSAWEARQELARIRELFAAGTRYLLYLAIPLQAGFILCGRQFLALWLGPDYCDEVYPIMCVLAAPLALSLSLSLANRVLQGTGRVKVWALLTVAQAVVAVTLSLVLVQSLGLQGVALATALPICLYSIALTVYTCRVFRVPFVTYLSHAFLRPLVATPVIVLGWLSVLEYLPATSWGSLVLSSVVGLGCAVTAIALLELPVLRYLTCRLRRSGVHAALGSRRDLAMDPGSSEVKPNAASGARPVGLLTPYPEMRRPPAAKSSAPAAARAESERPALAGDPLACSESASQKFETALNLRAKKE
jgi:O-antigen/teichoic acid export membrane protein